MFRRWRVARAGALATAFVVSGTAGASSSAWSSCESILQVSTDRFECSSNQTLPHVWEDNLSPEQARLLIQQRLKDHFELLASQMGRALDHVRHFLDDSGMQRLAVDAPIAVDFTPADTLAWRYGLRRPLGSGVLGDSLVRVLRGAERPGEAHVFSIQLAAFRGAETATEEARRLSVLLDEEAPLAAARVHIVYVDCTGDGEHGPGVMTLPPRQSRRNAHRVCFGVFATRGDAVEVRRKLPAALASRSMIVMVSLTGDLFRAAFTTAPGE